MDLLLEATKYIESEGKICSIFESKKKSGPIRGLDRKLEKDIERQDIYKDFLNGANFKDTIKSVIYSHNPLRTDVEEIFSDLVKNNTSDITNIFDIYTKRICHHTVIYVDLKGDILISDRKKASLDWCTIHNALKGSRKLPKDTFDSMFRVMKRLGYGVLNAINVNGRFYSPYSKNHIKTYSVNPDLVLGRTYHNRDFFGRYHKVKNLSRLTFDLSEPLPNEFLQNSS